jgi:hypothetical protein
MDADPWARLMKDVDHNTEPCYIDSVRYYKCTNGKKHEFVVVDIVPQQTQTVATVLLLKAHLTPAIHHHLTPHRSLLPQYQPMTKLEL